MGKFKKSSGAKTEKKEKLPKFHELMPEVDAEIADFFYSLIDENVVTAKFLGCRTQSDVLVVKKTSDDIALLLGVNVIVYVNEAVYQAIAGNEKLCHIAMADEISKVEYDLETGKVTICKKMFQSKESVLKKFSYEEVKAAKDLVKLTRDQLKEKEKESEPSID